MSVPTFPEGARQLPLEQILAAPAIGKGSARTSTVCGHLYSAIRSLQKAMERGRVDRRASFYNDNYMNRFPPVRVGNADHRALQDPGYCAKHARNAHRAGLRQSHERETRSWRYPNRSL